MKRPDFNAWKSKLTSLAYQVSQKVRERGGGKFSERASSTFVVVVHRLKKLLKQRNLSFYTTALTIILCTYFLSDLLGLWINSWIPEPRTMRGTMGMQASGSTRPTLDSFEGIFTRNLFNSKGLIPGEDNDGEVSGPALPTTLPIKLIGTLLLQDEAYSIATLHNDSDDKVYPVRMGDELPNLLRVERVEPRKVIFINLKNRRREYADLPQDPDSPEPSIVTQSNAPAFAPTESTGSSQRFNIPRGELEKNLSNLNQILTQARAIPHFENGAPSGYKLIQIVPGSIYDRLGLRNGDILREVNGESINNPQRAFEMLNDFKTMNSVELKIKRDNQASTMVYDITQ